jgi:hypothetical protein
VDAVERYLEAHSKYVEALEAIDLVATLLRNLGEQLLAKPEDVQITDDAVSLASAAQPDGGIGEVPRNWPTAAELSSLIEEFAAAKRVLVERGEMLLDARAPDSIKASLYGPT